MLFLIGDGNSFNAWYVEMKYLKEETHTFWRQNNQITCRLMFTNITLRQSRELLGSTSRDLIVASNSYLPTAAK